MRTNQIPRKHRPLLDFYVCMNDVCTFFKREGERAAGDNHMREETCPDGYYQGHPICSWCAIEMEVAHTDEIANPPHIQWDGIDSVHGKYYQLKF